ncbi:MAG: hypothetical protein R6X34_24430 [Chloroflexota bacterium]
MKAIVNATPLIALSLLDRLHLLPKLFAQSSEKWLQIKRQELTQ